MRVGIIGLLHESNTFVARGTGLDDFRSDVLACDSEILDLFQDAHHEVGGFLEELETSGAEAVPIFMARAMPSGVIEAGAFETLLSLMLEAAEEAGPLDGLLVAPHGATVSEAHRDADGHWLTQVRKLYGERIPIVGTIDAHANLSEEMVRSTDALIGYRTNPHLDQRQRGRDAARLLTRTIRGDVRPCMAVARPPMAISIDQQETEDGHLVRHFERADQQLRDSAVLSNSLVLGFPYADVEEMGTSTIVVTDNQPQLAQRLTNELATCLWEERRSLAGEFLPAEDALEHCHSLEKPICLLDMGDNVGGGSAADGTCLLSLLHDNNFWRSFVCILDPRAVVQAQDAGIGKRARLRIGGHVDDQHGRPVDCEVLVVGLYDGRFSEDKPRHGGFTRFDQGPTAIVETDTRITVMLTSRRMVPFSLEQLRACEIDPGAFDVLIAKGVNAPLAAYREVCRSFLRVDTPGSTRADMTRLKYQYRRRPMYPFEENAVYRPE